MAAIGAVLFMSEEVVGSCIMELNNAAKFPPSTVSAMAQGGMVSEELTTNY